MALDVARIRGLCFDLDGTLNDTDDIYARRFAAALLPLSVLPFFDRQKAARRLVMIAEAPGNKLLGLADTLGVDDEIAAVVEWLNRHGPRRQGVFQPVPGVPELLAGLHGHYPMSVVSARDERSTLMFLERFNLQKYFNCIATALTCQHTKPYPDPVLWAAEKMGVPPEACLMIGDTTVDIHAGRRAGAQTAGVLCGFGEEPELRRMGADIILPGTADLASVLR